MQTQTVIYRPQGGWEGAKMEKRNCAIGGLNTREYEEGTEMAEEVGAERGGAMIEVSPLLFSVGRGCHSHARGIWPNKIRLPDDLDHDQVQPS